MNIRHIRAGNLFKTWNFCLMIARNVLQFLSYQRYCCPQEWLHIDAITDILINGWNRVEEFKYLGTTLTNQNSIQEESRSRLKSGNAFYHSVQNLLSSSLLSKNLKIKIYRTIILPVVLYGCETWSVTLREERRLRVFENRVLRRVFGPKRDELRQEWIKVHNEELNDLYCLMICTPHQILFG